MSLAARGPGNTAVRSGPVSAAAVVCGFNIADACGRLGAGAGEALIGADECRFYRVLAPGGSPFARASVNLRQGQLRWPSLRARGVSARPLS